MELLNGVSFRPPRGVQVYGETPIKIPVRDALGTQLALLLFRPPQSTTNVRARSVRMGSTAKEEIKRLNAKPLPLLVCWLHEKQLLAHSVRICTEHTCTI